MIAEVYPLKRLPRAMKGFDYKIPEGLELQRGRFVTVPFRGSTVYGVVRCIKDKPERGIRLKTITSAHDEWLREEELSFFEWMSVDLAQSVGSILHMSLPTPPKRDGKLYRAEYGATSVRLPRSETELLTRMVRGMRDRREVFLQIPDLKRMTAVAAAYGTAESEQKILILLPTAKMAQEVAKQLSFLSPVLYTADLTNNERWRRWTAFRDMSSGVMIGTRIATLLPQHDVTSIFVLHSGDESHKQTDRNPRFDTRHLVWELHNRLHTNVFFCDVSPRLEDLVWFQDLHQLHWGRPYPTHLVDVSLERRDSEHPMLSSTLQRAIHQVVENGQQAVCVLNRKGRAARLLCQDCDHRFVCTDCRTGLAVFDHALRCARCQRKEPRPGLCPSCRGSNLFELGIGVESLTQLLAKLFPSALVASFSKDGDPKILKQANILVTTTYYLEAVSPFRANPAGLIALIDGDQSLYASHTRTMEDLLRTFELWRGIAQNIGAQFLVQTQEQDLYAQALTSPEKLLANELASSRDYGLPPFHRWFRIIRKDEEARKLELAMHELQKQLSSQTGIRCRKPTKQGDEMALLCSAEPDFVPNLLSNFTDLPDHYIIDTNVFP